MTSHSELRSLLVGMRYRASLGRFEGGEVEIGVAREAGLLGYCSQRFESEVQVGRRRVNGLFVAVATRDQLPDPGMPGPCFHEVALYAKRWNHLYNAWHRLGDIELMTLSEMLFADTFSLEMGYLEVESQDPLDLALNPPPAVRKVIGLYELGSHPLKPLSDAAVTAFLRIQEERARQDERDENTFIENDVLEEQEALDRIMLHDETPENTIVTEVDFNTLPPVEGEDDDPEN